MKKTFFALTCGILFLLASCGGSQTQKNDFQTSPAAVKQKTATAIPYREADNYFFRNDAPMPTNPKINTQEEFDALFGMATVMGDDGRPTAIDFNRQFVIAVVHPVTKKDVELDDERLLDDGQTLTFEYSVDRDNEVLGYEIQPILLIIVDRQYERENVELREVPEK